MDEHEPMRPHEQEEAEWHEEAEQQEQDGVEQQTGAVQQAHDIRAREEEAAEALISIGMAGEEVTREQGIQTETDIMEQVQALEKKNSELKKENTDLRKRLDAETFSVRIIEGNDHLTKFYTGLSTWVVFLHLYMFLSPFLSQPKALSLMDEFLITLMRLRLNLMVEDLAYQFRVSSSTASRIFHKWLGLMYVRLKFLVAWPSREIMEENMPMIFKQLYPRCRCIIDCSEIYIETPTSFDARAQTYSNYKKHNTIIFDWYYSLWHNIVPLPMLGWTCF